MSLAPVEDLVRARIGLDPQSLGANTFARLVAARMHARGEATPAGYAALLAADRPEWATLLEELVVPESWFFRGGATYFQQLAGWLRGRAGGAPRVLSVPSGGGEEPYSLALALADDGVPADAVRVVGVDLSPANVRRAEAGRYSAFAFREADADPRPRHFQPAGRGRWELHARVRAAVRFRVGNLAEADFLPGEPPFDLILCRNLFIYLTDAACAVALGHLDRLLTPGGRLCLTAAEADRLPPGRFVPDGPPGLAVFVRAAAAPRPAAKPRAAPRSTVIPRPAPVANPPAAPPAPGGIAAARALADAGNLDAARTACERAVAAAPTAAGYSLLGVLELAAGRAVEAEAAFRRSLYIDPDHREALTHLAVLCDRRGDGGPAAGLRRRLARLPEATA